MPYRLQSCRPVLPVKLRVTLCGEVATTSAVRKCLARLSVPDERTAIAMGAGILPPLLEICEMPYASSRLSTLAIVGSALLAIACSDRGPTDPAGIKVPSTIAADITPTTTIWDFVALSGVSSDVEIGASHAFTNPTAGTIVASMVQTLPAPGVVQLYSKGILEALGDEEKGLGFCFQPAGLADECTTTGEDEIGDSDGNGNYPSLILDFTGLTAGTVLKSVMMSSLQSLEAYKISSSTDGTTWSAFAAGVGTDAEPVITVPVTDPAIKYLRFEVGNGGAGNNYLVAAATTENSPPQVCEDQNATNYGGPLPCVYPPPGEGCTPGYWKQSQHFDSWVPTGLKPTDLVSTLFSKASLYKLNGKKLSAYTLVGALSFQGGSDLSGAAQILLRAGVAAELNARSGMDYPMTASEITTAVNNALMSGNRSTIITLAGQLDANNNLGCSLN